MAEATAPGKAILFGEHAVVYCRPAIAAPIEKVRARAVVQIAPSGSGITIDAPDLRRRYRLIDAPPADPLRAIVANTLDHLKVSDRSNLIITVTSTIPVARGLGSGTAVSVAIVRALAAQFDVPISDPDVSALTFEVEKLHHGSPSGVDNTVVTYRKPVYFVRGQSIETLRVRRPFRLAVADTGMASPTCVAVRDVSRCRECEPKRYDALFDAIGDVVRRARHAIESGEMAPFGRLMDDNQRLLEDLGVSSPELDRLVAAARKAGAGGAKLSGAGRGGNMIALVEEDTAIDVQRALIAAGATQVFLTEVR